MTSRAFIPNTESNRILCSIQGQPHREENDRPRAQQQSAPNGRDPGSIGCGGGRPRGGVSLTLD
jgi:hypothetical protein